MTHPLLQLLCWGRSWSQSVDQPQDFLEQFLRHYDLGHLEDDVAAMAHDLRADLHEFFPQARKRRLLDRLRQSQRPHEVGEIIGQRMQLKTHCVGGERTLDQFADYPIDESGQLLLDIYNSIAEKYLHDPDIGLDAYLSMRIRHGSTEMSEAPSGPRREPLPLRVPCAGRARGYGGIGTARLT
jgi:hypothetical protein